MTDEEEFLTEEEVLLAKQKAALYAESLRLEEEMARWVSEQGSERLRLAAQAGVLDRSRTVYLNERLEVEQPGWLWLGLWLGLDGEVLMDIHNPSVATLTAFLAVRAASPSAGLHEVSLYGSRRPVAVLESELPWTTRTTRVLPIPL
jgi:hypothetical protein